MLGPAAQQTLPESHKITQEFVFLLHEHKVEQNIYNAEIIHSTVINWLNTALKFEIWTTNKTQMACRLPYRCLLHNCQTFTSANKFIPQIMYLSISLSSTRLNAPLLSVHWKSVPVSVQYHQWQTIYTEM